MRPFFLGVGVGCAALHGRPYDHAVFLLAAQWLLSPALTRVCLLRRGRKDKRQKEKGIISLNFVPFKTVS